MDDAYLGIVLEKLAQDGNEGLIDFHSGHRAAFLSQKPGEAAQTCTDFQNIGFRA